MRQPQPQSISGHVSLRKGKRGGVWYAKYRLPDGRQVQKRIGRAWTEKTAPPEGYFTKASAKAHLDELLVQARQGTLPGMVRTGRTFRDAPRSGWTTARRSATARRRRCATIATWSASSTVSSGVARSRRSRRKRSSFGSAVQRIEPNPAEVPRLPWLDLQAGDEVHGLPRNPADVVERPRVRRAAKIDVLRPEEVLALVRAAESEQDAAIFHTAAFAGLRMGELLALRWRDVDFTRRTIHVRENWTQGETTTPKGGTERAVPMAEEVAQRLARLGQREHVTTDDDLVFCTPRGQHVGYKSLKERYRAALRTADLREDFRFQTCVTPSEAP